MTVDCHGLEVISMKHLQKYQRHFYIIGNNLKFLEIFTNIFIRNLETKHNKRFEIIKETSCDNFTLFYCTYIPEI